MGVWSASWTYETYDLRIWSLVSPSYDGVWAMKDAAIQLSGADAEKRNEEAENDVVTQRSTKVY